jgi:hypothetical protein
MPRFPVSSTPHLQEQIIMLIDFSQFDFENAMPVSYRTWHCSNPACDSEDGGGEGLGPCSWHGEIESLEYCPLCGGEGMPGSVVEY